MQQSVCPKYSQAMCDCSKCQRSSHVSIVRTIDPPTLRHPASRSFDKCRPALVRRWSTTSNECRRFWPNRIHRRKWPRTAFRMWGSSAAIRVPQRSQTQTLSHHMIWEMTYPMCQAASPNRDHLKGHGGGREGERKKIALAHSRDQNSLWCYEMHLISTALRHVYGKSPVVDRCERERKKRKQNKAISDWRGGVISRSRWRRRRLVTATVDCVALSLFAFISHFFPFFFFFGIQSLRSRRKLITTVYEVQMGGRQ